MAIKIPKTNGGALIGNIRIAPAAGGTNAQSVYAAAARALNGGAAAGTGAAQTSAAPVTLPKSGVNPTGGKSLAELSVEQGQGDNPLVQEALATGKSVAQAAQEAAARGRAQDLAASRGQAAADAYLDAVLPQIASANTRSAIVTPEQYASALAAPGQGGTAGRQTASATAGQAFSAQPSAAAADASVDGLLAEYKALYGEDGPYLRALAQQRAAQDAAVQRSVNALTAQKEDVAQQYADLFRQLYRDRVRTEKNIGQQLAAAGLTGGAAESTLLGLGAQYEDALRQGEQGRIGALSALDRAIADAYLTGGLQSAGAEAAARQQNADNYAGVLRTLISRADTQSSRALAAADTARTYAQTLARQLLAEGVVPSAELLAAAGIDAATAQAMAEIAAQPDAPALTAAQVLSALKNGVQTPAVLSAYEYYYGQPYAGAQTGSAQTTGAGGGSGYNNGGLTNAQVRALQNVYRAQGIDIAADGFWGPDSQRRTGKSSAKAAWEEQLAALPSGDLTQVDYEPVTGAIRWGNRIYADTSALRAAADLAYSAGVVTREQAQSLLNSANVQGLRFN